jgi:phosphate starvation-inducible PhoH-like protein
MASAPHTDEVYKQKRVPKGEVKFKDFQLRDFQKPVIEFIHNKQMSVLIADPGCSKTTLALYFALTKLRKREYERIIITKPIVEVGVSIGFLPGSIEEKVESYLISYTDIIDKLVGVQEREKLFKEKQIVFEAIQFSRGRTYESSIIILDEAQGCTLHELMTFATRTHESSKLIIMADPLQSDIKHTGISEFLEIVSDEEQIGIMELGEEFQMRSQLVQRIYKKYKEHINNTKKK